MEQPRTETHPGGRSCRIDEIRALLDRSGAHPGPAADEIVSMVGTYEKEIVSLIGVLVPSRYPDHPALGKRQGT